MQNGTVRPSPSFRLTGSVALFPKFELKDKHADEFKLLDEQIIALDEQTKELMKKLTKMHKRRTKYAHLITGLQKKSHEESQSNIKSRSIQKQQERFDRLGVCTRLLDSKNHASILSKNIPLPNLAPLRVEEKVYDNNNFDASDTFANFIRNATVTALSSYFNENGIPRLLVYCGDPFYKNKFFNINIDGVVEVLPAILASISGQNRTAIFQRMLEAFRESSQFEIAFETMALSDNPIDVLNHVEHFASLILKCKRVKFLVSSPISGELTYIHNGEKRTIPMSTGLISDVVGKGNYAILVDPCNTEQIDIAVESYIFEGSRNCLIAPLMHPEFPNPFVFVCIDKLRDDGFTPNDFIGLYFYFRNITAQIKLLVRELTSITEKDMTKLVKGLSEIASVDNAHDMIYKIITVSNNLTDASNSRLFTVVGDCLCEETPGTNLAGKLLTIDRGLTCRAAIYNETMNYFLPRRIKDFSVLIDDITEPRIWSMVASPTKYKGEVKGAFVLYNRKNSTFFSAKETYFATSLGSCVLPLLHTCCESTKLHESLERNNVNIVRAYNLTVFSLKSIQAAGTPKLFQSMKDFCENMQPKVNFRFLIYKGDKLYEGDSQQTIQSEPQLLDAICDMKPTAAINAQSGILVLPIKSHSTKQVYLFEFKSPLMKLKTEEESNGILQCTRILHSLEEASAKLQLPETTRKMGKTRSKNKTSSQKLARNESASSSSSFFSLDRSTDSESKMPFIPLSLRNIHNEDGFTSTNIFNINQTDTQSKSDKFVIVSSAVPNFEAQSFEEQLDAGELQIYPFDPFLSSILMSFSKLSTRQVNLHSKIVALNQLKPILRALHLLGNVLATPMPFTELLNILLVSFTNLFGKGVALEIFDPPLRDETETDPNALNLERDRKIFASIKIPSPMSPDKSVALSYFADLVLALLASRSDSKPDSPIEIGIPRNLKPELSYNFLIIGLKENILIATEIFTCFKVNEVLDITKERLTMWMHRFATNPEEQRFFITALDAIQFAYTVFCHFDLFNQYTPSELCAFLISVFVRGGFPHMRPRYKYSRHLKFLMDKKRDPKVLCRITTGMIMLSDPECDLLEHTPEEVLCGVLELMADLGVTSVPAILARMSLIAKKGFDPKNKKHRELFSGFVTEMSQMSPFFRPIEVFNEFCLASQEPQQLIMYKAEKIVAKYVKVICAINEYNKIFLKAFSDKIPWLKSKGESYFQQTHQEEEELGNISLFDAR